MTKVIPNHRYDHYKGGKYLVLFVVDDSTNRRAGNKIVIYISLTHGMIKGRDLKEFLAPVTWPDGKKRPRFIPEK